MSDTLCAIRGMKDMLPVDAPAWQQVESIIRNTMHVYGFQEIRTPVLEKTALFSRSVGEVTDIVEKEMYTFNDRNGDSLSLRPENTASVIRAGIEAGLFYNQVQKLWYMGPQFRHERPQKGRLRQFHQCGVEVIGIANPAADAEVLLLTASLLRRLGLDQCASLQLNSLGTPADRTHYREALVSYFSRYEKTLDEECQRRLHTNPLRILDSKNPDLAAIIHTAPSFADFLGTEARAHLDTLCQLLSDNHLTYTLNPRLVRGLDYYCHTVFEWVTTLLGAQGTVCAGGRYDGLVEQLGGKPAPGIGFAMGLERIILLMTEQHLIADTQRADIYISLQGPVALSQGLSLAERLRAKHPHLAIVTDTSDASLKSQLKRANSLHAKTLLTIDETRAAAHEVLVRAANNIAQGDAVMLQTTLLASEIG